MLEEFVDVRGYVFRRVKILLMIFCWKVLVLRLFFYY